MPLSGVCGEIKQKLFKQLFVTKFHRILGLFLLSFTQTQ